MNNPQTQSQFNKPSSQHDVSPKLMSQSTIPQGGTYSQPDYTIRPQPYINPSEYNQMVSQTNAGQNQGIIGGILQSVNTQNQQQNTGLTKQPTIGDSQHIGSQQYQSQTLTKQPTGSYFQDNSNKPQPYISNQPDYSNIPMTFSTTQQQQSTGFTKQPTIGQGQTNVYNQGQYSGSQNVGTSQYGTSGLSRQKTNYVSTALNVDPLQYIFACDEAEVNEIFDSFQRSGIVNLNEFIEALKTTGMGANSTLFTDRMADWVTANRTAEVNEVTFKNLFRFDLRDENDFRYIFRLIDDNKSQNIGAKELAQISKNFDLNLSNDDIRLMIDNLKTKNSDSVERDELHRILYGKK